MKLLFADFETRGIERRPDYPPKPVGLALWPRGGDGAWPRPKYLSFGHESENNSTESETKRIYKDYLRLGYVPVWHHAGFDLDVTKEAWGVAWPREWHDTLLLAFLVDPRFTSFALKPLAEKVLGEPPTERDELLLWLKANVPEARKKPSEAMKHLWRAPGPVAGRYAVGDITRTVGLFKKFWQDVSGDARLLAAYDRERQLTPHLVTMESRGIPIRTWFLARELPQYEKSLARIETGLLDRLRVPKREREEFVFTGDCLADQLEKTKKVTEWILTKKGNRATNAEDLREVCLDGELVDELEVRSQIATCVQTFMRPWLASALEHDGRFYARFNQTRQESERGGQIGAVTGRLSMSPNLQNVIRSDKDRRVPKLRDYVWSGARGLLLLQRDYCFSADTEVLTDSGWKLFRDLDQTEHVAEWKDGAIQFSKPVAYQKVKFNGSMVRVHGKRTTDLLVTPNHRCLYLSRDDEERFVRADEYPTARGRKQLHAGVYVGLEKTDVLDAGLTLVCAVQADAKVVMNKNGTARAIFYLKKKRKLERLRTALKESNLRYEERDIGTAKPGFHAILFYLPSWFASLLVLPRKLFVFERLLKLPVVQRRLFLQELRHWDGTPPRESHGWSYGTCTRENADTVQALATVSGYRSTLHRGRTRAGRWFYSVGMTKRTDRTHTDRFIKSRKRYDGWTYCVTMPWSTVVVRRNGKVMITGQSQQELRITAHYEGGPFLKMYLDDPKIDAHDAIKELIRRQVGVDLERRDVKDLNFGLLYGMGGAKLARKLKIETTEARRLSRAHLAALPGIKTLRDKLSDAARDREPLWTWGGRRYYCEEPKVREGRIWSFEYKQLNVLVQGSAADCTKQAMVNYFAAGHDDRWPLLLQVHDELLLTAPKGDEKRAHAALREAMADVEFKVPMLSDGKTGAVSWRRMHRVED